MGEANRGKVVKDKQEDQAEDAEDPSERVNHPNNKFPQNHGEIALNYFDS